METAVRRRWQRARCDLVVLAVCLAPLAACSDTRESDQDDGGGLDSAGIDAAGMDAEAEADAGPVGDSGAATDAMMPLDAASPADATTDSDAAAPAPACGNGVIECGEDCDYGAEPGSECFCPQGCGHQCGDGFVEEVGESCDDGNNVSCDGCRSDCLTEDICGDGRVDCGEECDDGNQESGDGCSSECRSELCGNGVLDPGTSCDPGVLRRPEQCDDGNQVDGDGCSSTCQLERCGDGNLDPFEECDDGNQVDGDGCSSGCAEETERVFRMTELSLVDPVPTFPRPGDDEGVILPMCLILDTEWECCDCLGWFSGCHSWVGLNTSVNRAISGDHDEDEDLDLNLLLMLDPQAQPSARLLQGTCNVPSGSCEHGEACTWSPASPSILSGAYTKRTSGTCLAPDPTHLSPNRDHLDTSRAAPPTVEALEYGCFEVRADSTVLSLPFEFHDDRHEVEETFDMELVDVRLAGRLVGDPPSRIEDGMIIGFLPQAVAEATPVVVDFYPESSWTDATFDEATVAELLPGSSSVCQGCSPRDRGPCDQQVGFLDEDCSLDKGEDSRARDTREGECGWWMHLEFEATAMPDAAAQ